MNGMHGNKRSKNSKTRKWLDPNYVTRGYCAICGKDVINNRMTCNHQARYKKNKRGKHR